MLKDDGILLILIPHKAGTFDHKRPVTTISHLVEDFKIRSENNFQNRCLHHHVFDTDLVVQIIKHKKLQMLAVETILAHIIVIARK